MDGIFQSTNSCSDISVICPHDFSIGVEERDHKETNGLGIKSDSCPIHIDLVSSYRRT